MIIMNIIFSFILIYCNCQNIILNFKRLSFNKLKGKENIDDYINYDIYTDLFVGTPPQKVTHFIDPNDCIFQFKKLLFEYNPKKFNKSYINQIKQEYFSLYNSSKSSTYKGYYSDNFTIITTDNKAIQIPELQFTIYFNKQSEQ